MTITLGVIIAIITGGVGFILGAAAMVKNPAQYTTPQLPEHQHVWGEWEQMEKVPITQDGHYIADEYTQHRQCTLCQFTEYHTDRI